MVKLLLSRKIVSAVVVIACSVAPYAVRAQAPADDPVLKALQAELEREKSLLVLPGMLKPYFIEYRLDDFSTYEAVANYGALTREEEGHRRVVRVTVRVGDYAVDSSTGRGEGSVQFAPEENDLTALRYVLWTATDDAYKNALQAYSAKQAAMQRYQSARKENDFSQEKPLVKLEPLRKLEIDRAEWRKRIIDASGLYASATEVKDFAPQVQYSTANVRGTVMNRYLVNTEGTAVRTSSSGYANAISVGTQAPDGMRLGRDNGSTAVSAKELEGWPDFRKQVIDDIKSLQALREAPVVDGEDYHGPVLFSGDAASDVMNRLFVGNVEAERPDLGTTARTTGAYTSSYRARVLPELMNVVDNPLEPTFNGHSVVGAYNVDDEGVAAQSVNVVTAGKLENYLLGRTPIRDFPSSNGHGRGAPGAPPHSRSGVMIFSSSKPVPAAQMQQKLLAMAKEQKRDVYSVETMGGDAPRLLYLVHPDGTRQLVRGAAFDELDNRSLRSEIIALGDDPYINNSLGAVPQTTIVPSLLFGDMGVKRASEEQQKLPYYPPPPLER